MDNTEIELTQQDEKADVETKDLAEEEVNEVAGGNFSSQTVTTVTFG